MSDLALVATTLKVAEKSKILYEESPNYTEEELLADIGGSLGLILGLNLLDVLIFSGSVWAWICSFGEFLSNFTV